MAGKRITDLPLASTLYNSDFIPVARDTQTVRLPGEALVASHVYEVHRKINQYSSQKYLFTENESLLVTNSINNSFVGVDAPSLRILIDSSEAFELGFQIEIFSASESETTIFYPNGDFKFKVIENSLEAEVTGMFKGFAGNLKPYESIRLILIKNNTWLKLPGSGLGTTTTVIVSPPVIEDVVKEPIPTTPPPVVVIDTTGTKPDIVRISSNTTLLRTINSTDINPVTVQAINGLNAY